MQITLSVLAARLYLPIIPQRIVWIDGFLCEQDPGQEFTPSKFCYQQLNSLPPNPFYMFPNLRKLTHVMLNMITSPLMQ